MNLRRVLASLSMDTFLLQGIMAHEEDGGSVISRLGLTEEVACIECVKILDLFSGRVEVFFARHLHRDLEILTVFVAIQRG